MQRLEVSDAARPIYGSLGVKRLIGNLQQLSPHIYLNQKNLHVCAVHQSRLKLFIIQQMHTYTIRRYN